jgi:hypothetical protein
VASAFNFNEYVETVKDKLSHPKNLDNNAWERIINEAINVYSLYRPDIKVADTSGTGVFDYSLPADYEDGFSSILSVEYPFDSNDQIPSLLKAGRDYRLYRDPTSLKLRFLSATPSTSETFRLTYTIVHVVTTAASTIPPPDERAVANLASALLAEQLAAEFEKTSPSTMPDITFDLRTKSKEYHDQSDRYYRLWSQQMGIPLDGRPSAASLHADTDWYLAGGLPTLTHQANQ